MSSAANKVFDEFDEVMGTISVADLERVEKSKAKVALAYGDYAVSKNETKMPTQPLVMTAHGLHGEMY
jgi:hypothetical protein